MVFYYFCVENYDKNGILLTFQGSLYGALFLKYIHLNKKYIKTFKENFSINNDKVNYIIFFLKLNIFYFRDYILNII